MVEPNDWRLENTPEDAEGATLLHLQYKQPSDHWDHEHCVFCWQKIAEPKILDSVHEGYVLKVKLGHEEWVCPECFADLSQHFGWSAKP